MRRADLVAKQQRADTLTASADLARKMRVMLDPDVTAMLDTKERELMEAAIAATDDKSRSSALLEIKAWRAVRTIITKTVQQEHYAVNKLKELSNVS